MVDALKNFMSTMTDTITCQVAEQVKRAIEAANSARPPPYLDYIPTLGGEPSHRPERIQSPHYTERERGVSRSDRSGRPYTGQPGRRAAARPGGRPTQGATAKLTTASTPYTTHSRRITWFEEQEQTSKTRGEVRGHPMLRRPPRMTTHPKPQNARKYCEFHEQSGHTMTECRELKKALYKLVDKGQIDLFLKRGPRLSTILMTLLLRSPGLSIQGVGCLVPCTLALTRRRDKLHFLGITAFIFGPLTLVHVVEPCSLAWATLLAPVAASPRPSQAPPLAGAASSSYQLHVHSDQPSAFPNVAGVEKQAPPIFGVPSQLPPPGEVATSSSVTFGGSEAPEVTKC
ncbi:hypothetical protein Cgig2_020168 [Carnegiea gigantea]|uniref:Reverse transcriptase domain-containing protein n=1 Tax=Carnegiea gigantea TaxID=171969 RepID=A0A9Q1KXB0_9CARY|nr:hypothetical protein Cgig2_020168 [Carnegiea gigantea]